MIKSKNLLLILIILFIFIAKPVLAADEEPFVFIEKTYINDNLEIENGVGYKDRNVFFRIPIQEDSKHQLEFNLMDGQKTCVEFEELPEKLIVRYWIEKNAAGDKIDLSTFTHKMIDYEKTPPEEITLEVDEVPYENADNKVLKYEIGGANISDFPGFTITVGQSELKLRWDRTEKLVSIQTGNYSPGNVMPVRFFINKDTNPEPAKEMFILKSLAGFTTTPTHYDEVRVGTNTDTEDMDINPFYEQNQSDEYKRINTDEKYANAGTRPGIKIEFKEPMQWDEGSWEYKRASSFPDGSHNFKDIGAIFELKDGVDENGANSQFEFLLSGEEGEILKLENEGSTSSINNGVKYEFDDSADIKKPGTYRINIIKDKTGLKDQTKYIEWTGLISSHTYVMTIKFQRPKDNREKYIKYQLPFFTPSTKYAYTYLKYDVVRISENEGFLKVYPYYLKKGDIGEEVRYRVLQNTEDAPNLDEINSLWLTTTHTSEKEDDVLFIPIEFGSQSYQKSYQIIMDYSNQKIKSQVVIYDTEKDKDYPVSTSKIKDVDNLIVVPFDDKDKDYPIKAKFDMIFNAPKNNGKFNELDKVFERLEANGSDPHIYYELYINDIPEERSDNKFEMIKVFKVSKDSGKYIIEDVTPQENPIKITHAVAEHNESGSRGYKNGYNAGNDLFKMNEIILADNIKEDLGFVKVIKPKETIAIVDIANEKYSFTSSKAEIENDSVNFLRLKAVTYIKTGESGSEKVLRKESDMSMPYSISLSDSTIKVPIVDDLQFRPYYDEEKDQANSNIINKMGEGGRVDLSMKLDSEERNRYIKKMLQPIDKKLIGITYRVFIANDKAKIDDNLDDNSATHLSGLNADDISEINGINISYLNIAKADMDSILDKGDVYYFDIKKVPEADGSFDNREMERLLKDLRQKSQVYIAVKTIFHIKDKDDNSAPEELRKSMLSKILEITVPTDINNPDEGKLPLAPDNFTVTFIDDAKKNAKLNFFVPKGFQFKSGGVGFEIVATKNKALASTDTNESLETILSRYGENEAEAISVFTTDNGDTLDFKRLKREGTGISEENISKNLFKKLVDEITIIDDNNTPNSLYYYYVRTVSLDEENKVLGRSNFISATITTDNISAPKNLKINLEEAKYSRNEKNEIVVEFEAPVPKKTDIPNVYDFEIWVKMEDEDYKLVPNHQLAALETSFVGYHKFIYKLDNLKSGKTYQIKVRMVDKANGQDVLPDSQGTAYPKSAFSNILIARTAFDQNDYDKEQKFNHYLDYFEKKAREMLKRPYYVIDRDRDSIEVYYKIDYFYNLLNGKRLVLDSFDKEGTTYYIPSDYVEEIKKNDLEIELRSLGNSVYIGGDALKTAIADAEDDVRNNYGKDYLLSFTLDSEKRTTNISYKQVNSEVVSVDYSNIIYGMKMPQLENEFKVELDELMLKERSYLANELERQDYIDDKKFLEIALDHVLYLEDDFIEKSYSIFNSSVKFEERYDEFDENVTYALSRNDDTLASFMYKREKSSYIPTDADFFSNKYSHDAKDIDKYVLLVKDGSSVSDAQNETMTYYGLEKVFDKWELENPSATTTKGKYLKAIGNMLGKTETAVAKDFAMTLSGMSNSLINEDAYYAFLKSYAKAKNINVENASVYDYYIAEDIDEVNSKYRRYILKGLNLSLLDSSDGYIRPKTNTNMKMVMELLIKLHKGVN